MTAIDSDYKYVGIKWALVFEWAQLLSRDNGGWCSFHPASMEVIFAPHVGRVELSLIILGLGFVVRWNYSETPMVRQALATRQSMEEVCARLEEIFDKEDAKHRETLH